MIGSGCSDERYNFFLLVLTALLSFCFCLLLVVTGFDPTNEDDNGDGFFFDNDDDDENSGGGTTPTCNNSCECEREGRGGTTMLLLLTAVAAGSLLFFVQWGEAEEIASPAFLNCAIRFSVSSDDLLAVPPLLTIIGRGIVVVVVVDIASLGRRG